MAGVKIGEAIISSRNDAKYTVPIPENGRDLRNQLNVVKNERRDKTGSVLRPEM